MIVNTIKSQYDGPSQTKTNHTSLKLDHKNDSILEVLRLVFWSFEPVNISSLKKITDTSKVDDFYNEDN
ncbi:hypothetical protein H5410_005107, partial [Solanum commersonii]